MGPKFNAVTGKWEDEQGKEVPAPATGVPAPTATVPSAPSVASPSAPAPTIPSIFPAKPEHETTVESKIESPEARAARLKTLTAEGAVATAREGVADVTARIAQTEAEGAKNEADALERHAKEQREREAADAKVRDEWIAGQKAGIAAEVDAKKKAGAARADYWKGNEAGEVAVAIFRAIQEGIQSYQGRSGPTGVERIVEAKMAAHEKKLVAEWEATADANRLKKENFQEWERARERVRLAATNQNAVELGVIRARAQQFAKNLEPEKQKAVAELTTKLDELEARRRDQAYAQGYDKAVRTTNRSPSGSASAAQLNKPLSGEVAELADAATQYEKLAARQKELTRNGIPQYGPEATEWEKNEQAMRSLLQKKFGKSDNDAKLAEEQQGSPGFWSKLWSKTPGTNTITNYHKSLDVNAEQLRSTADERIRLEGPEGTLARRTGEDKKPAEKKPTLREEAARRMGIKEDGSKVANDNGVEKLVNGKKARVYADGTFEYVN